MKILDPGHAYIVQSYSPIGGIVEYGEPIYFFKKIGEGFPGNTGEPHIGTNCQELLRVLIDRVKYLDNQIPCEENKKIISSLRNALYNFEYRAAKRRNQLNWDFSDPIENEPACKECGHINCGRHR